MENLVVANLIKPQASSAAKPGAGADDASTDPGLTADGAGSFGTLLAGQIANAARQESVSDQAQALVQGLPLDTAESIDPSLGLPGVAPEGLDLSALMAAMSLSAGKDAPAPSIKNDPLEADALKVEASPEVAGALTVPLALSGQLPMVPVMQNGAPQKDSKTALSQSLVPGEAVSTLASTGQQLPSAGKELPELDADPADSKAIRGVGRQQDSTLSGLPNSDKLLPSNFKELLGDKLNPASAKEGTLLSDTGVSSTVPGNVQHISNSVEKAALPAKPELSIPQKVGSESWGSGLGDKVVWVVGNQVRGAEIHLNPPSMGPLEVRVNVTDGQANLAFMTHHASVREAIEAATPRLREMLGDTGISMGSVSVNVGTFAQQQQEQSRQPGQAAGVIWPLADESLSPGLNAATMVRSLHQRGMVDLFA